MARNGRTSFTSILPPFSDEGPQKVLSRVGEQVSERPYGCSAICEL
jgi:hypothetical protein